MTSEGKSAREVQELIASVKVESANLAEVVGKILEMLPPKIETFPTGDLSPAESVKIKLIELIDEHTQRESRLSIAAALEMAQNTILTTKVPGEYGSAFVSGDADYLAKAIDKIAPESVAHARAEHDRAVRLECCKQVCYLCSQNVPIEETSEGFWHRPNKRDYSQCNASGIRASATEAQER